MSGLRLIAIALLVIFGVSACTTVQTITTPADMTSPAPGKYALSVERGKWLGANSRPLGVYLDGNGIGSLLGGQSLTVYVPPGRYTVAVHIPMKHVPAGNAGSIVVDVSAAEQPILHANLSALGYGGWKIERVR